MLLYVGGGPTPIMYSGTPKADATVSAVNRSCSISWASAAVITIGLYSMPSPRTAVLTNLWPTSTVVTVPLLLQTNRCCFVDEAWGGQDASRTAAVHEELGRALLNANTLRDGEATGADRRDPDQRMVEGVEPIVDDLAGRHGDRFDLKARQVICAQLVVDAAVRSHENRHPLRIEHIEPSYDIARIAFLENVGVSENQFALDPIGKELNMRLPAVRLAQHGREGGIFRLFPHARFSQAHQLDPHLGNVGGDQRDTPKNGGIGERRINTDRWYITLPSARPRLTDQAKPAAPMVDWRQGVLAGCSANFKPEQLHTGCGPCSLCCTCCRSARTQRSISRKFSTATSIRSSRLATPSWWRRSFSALVKGFETLRICQPLNAFGHTVKLYCL